LRVENDATAVAVSAVEHHIPVLVTVLTDEQTGRFVEAVQESASSNVLSAPKVTMLNGQRAQIFSGVQRPFVVGVKERSDGGFEPQVRIADEGFDLSLHTELVEGQDGVDLAAALELSDIQDVQEFSTKVAGKDLTVQVPSVRHTRVQTTSRLRDNQTLLLCVPPTYDQKHYAWVLLTARIIAE
jgi:type II secretory pathway component GspD/PulD (secretin)